MKTLTLEAPAKINLTLDILGRRTDGYHDMRMVMQAVSLGDTVTVAEAAGGFSLADRGHLPFRRGRSLWSSGRRMPFFHRLGRPVPGAEVRLAKRVPAYAGLGGGSADVAAVLRCLRPCTPRICRGRRWRRSGWQWAAMCPSASGAAHVLQRDGVSLDGPAASAGLCHRTVQAGLRPAHTGAVCPAGRGRTLGPAGYGSHGSGVGPGDLPPRRLPWKCF